MNIDAGNSRANNRRNICKITSATAWTRARAWTPVIVGLIIEETTASARLPVTAWTRARAWKQ